MQTKQGILAKKLKYIKLSEKQPQSLKFVVDMVFRFSRSFGKIQGFNKSQINVIFTYLFKMIP